MEQDIIQQIRNLENQVLRFSSEKFKSLLLTPDAILLHSKGFVSADEFREAFGKNQLLTTQKTIPYNDIKVVKNAQGSDVLTLKWKGTLGVTESLDLDFSDSNGMDNLMLYLEKVCGLRRSEVQLTSFKAILPNLFWIAVAVGITALCYNIAVDYEATGQEPNATGRKAFFKLILIKTSEVLGPYGVLAVGALVSAFLGYKAWQKFQNPPVETRLEP